MKNLLLFIAVLLFTDSAFAQQSDVIATFIKNNPEKSAIYYVHNGKVLADINSDRKSPLASTVKIIVAIEYATQVANGTISPATLVDTAEIHKYYIPGTDGGAQPGWLSLMEKQNMFKDGKVPLEEVAKGMINFSSNANTEYLLDLLGPDNVNAQLTKLSLKDHDEIYYFISALGVINGKSQFQLEQMSMDEYIAACNEVHHKLKTDKDFKATITNLPMTAQKVWSDRLAGSSPKEYVSLMQKINSRTFFDEKTQGNIDIVMEGILANPANKQWLKHAGFKGGSTAWVLTKAMYATTIKDETTELVYFFNDLTIAENQQLQQNMNKFELGILSNRDGARGKILDILNKD